VEGTVRVGKLARAKLPSGWLFLNGTDGRSFLVAHGNEPSSSVLGIAIPPDYAESRTFAVYQYADEGHVDDSESVDYDELLRSMKEGAVEDSKRRARAKLGTVELIGWAEPPHYDKAQHKLFWAEKLKFSDNDGFTLNYNVRILGRSGYLVVNGVGDFE